MEGSSFKGVDALGLDMYKSDAKIGSQETYISTERYPNFTSEYR